MKGPLLGTNPAIDREEAKVDKMIGSISGLLIREPGLSTEIGIERLRDPPTEWGRQFDVLGLNPE